MTIEVTVSQDGTIALEGPLNKLWSLRRRLREAVEADRAAWLEIHVVVGDAKTRCGSADELLEVLDLALAEDRTWESDDHAASAGRRVRVPLQIVIGAA